MKGGGKSNYENSIIYLYENLKKMKKSLVYYYLSFFNVIFFFGKGYQKKY
jgi:hypothetical protein